RGALRQLRKRDVARMAQRLDERILVDRPCRAFADIDVADLDETAGERGAVTEGDVQDTERRGAEVADEIAAVDRRGEDGVVEHFDQRVAAAFQLRAAGERERVRSA